MAYIGLPPKANFTSGLLDRFTSTTGTTVTLTHDISSENDIVVFVNFVKQDSTTYSVGGTGNKTLTLGGTLVSSDIVEVHYLNIVGQTVNPSANSVGNSQTASSIINGQTAETSIADSDEVLIYDASATALRKMTRANFVSGAGESNTPAFDIRRNSYQTVTNVTNTKVALDVAGLDTDSGFDSSNNRWTVPSGKGGTYFVAYSIFADTGGNGQLEYFDFNLSVNGTSTLAGIIDFRNTNGRQVSATQQGVLSLSVGDYLELFATISDTSGNPQFGGGSSGGERYKSHISGFRIIAS